MNITPHLPWRRGKQVAFGSTRRGAALEPVDVDAVLGSYFAAQAAQDRFLDGDVAPAAPAGGLLAEVRRRSAAASYPRH